VRCCACPRERKPRVEPARQSGSTAGFRAVGGLLEKTAVMPGRSPAKARESHGERALVCELPGSGPGHDGKNVKPARKPKKKNPAARPGFLSEINDGGARAPQHHFLPRAPMLLKRELKRETRPPRSISCWVPP